MALRAGRHDRVARAISECRRPARFPRAQPELFINFLTHPGDMVVDIFAGSNTTGEAAGGLGRKWIAVESELDYAIGSAFRFMQDWPDDECAEFVDRCRKRSQDRRSNAASSDDA